ncbi:MAG: aerotolerance protein BatA [Chitinophagales bacterium]|nr:MAG: aerotolerance protein BatA [Chitinophagales bacterium]
MTFWNNITFANPKAFLLLAVPVVFWIWYAWRYKKIYPEFRLSSAEAFLTLGSSLRGRLKLLLPLLRSLAFAMIVVAFARPQSTLKEENISTEGIDIILALDISGSMKARDLQPDRLEAAKKLATDFISGRPNDRMGLVVFAGESFTQCPLTTDHNMLKKLITELKEGLVEDGTAIGMGLANAVNRLRESEAKSKVIILITDGENNAGFIDPLTATELAQQFGVRVYTIGVGTIGTAPFPFQYGGRTIYQNVEVRIDEKLLREIAVRTGGKYFRATDNQSLRKIFQEIDQLERSIIQVASIQRVSEEFYPFALAALILLLLELTLRYVFLRSLP